MNKRKIRFFIILFFQIFHLIVNYLIMIAQVDRGDATVSL
jgi:hypothetical protein